MKTEKSQEVKNIVSYLQENFEGRVIKETPYFIGLVVFFIMFNLVLRIRLIISFL